MAGIYIHIPFCKQACNYCDFHFSTQLKNKSELVKAICKEIELRKEYLETFKIDTIYFGGGTPSLLSESELSEIFNSLSKFYKWNDLIEITLECNPDDLSKEKLTHLKATGINRLSIGLQSFDDEELKWMNRAHNALESFKSVKLAQESGFSNISIDLIYGSKFQSLESWETTLLQAIDLNIQHISSYNLTVENKTALGYAVEKGKEKIIDEELSSHYFLKMIEILEANHFEHYEISNFAKEGFISQHNSNYWKGEKYIGIGPSAHSFNGLTRQWNIANNQVYLNAIGSGSKFFEFETLTTNEKFNEYVLLGLRTKWGCDTYYILENFGQKYKTHFLTGLKKIEPEFYISKDSSIILTRTGKLLADKIAMNLFI